MPMAWRGTKGAPCSQNAKVLIKICPFIYVSIDMDTHTHIIIQLPNLWDKGWNLVKSTDYGGK